MGSVIILLASQALALAAPAAGTPSPQGARVVAIATVEILHAETTRIEAGPQALKRHLSINSAGQVSIEFE